MPEITTDDLKWLDKLEDNVKWNANLMLGETTEQWVVSKRYNNTAVFAVRGTVDDGGYQYILDDVLQNALAEYVGTGLVCVNAKTLRSALKKVKKLNDNGHVYLKLNMFRDVLIVVGVTNQYPDYGAEEDNTKTLTVDAPLHVHGDFSFEVDQRTWISALMGFEGDVWIIVRPQGSGIMFVITNRGNRAAFIMGYHTDNEAQYDHLSREFWEARTRKAIRSCHRTEVMDYGELCAFAKSIDLSGYTITTDPEILAKNLVTVEEQNWKNQVDQIAIDDVVTICYMRERVLRVIGWHNAFDYALLQELDGKDHYPVMRHNLRKIAHDQQAAV